MEDLSEGVNDRLVGRSRELARLVSYLDGALAGQAPPLCVALYGQDGRCQVRSRFRIPYLWSSVAAFGGLLRGHVDKSVDKQEPTAA